MYTYAINEHVIQVKGNQQKTYSFAELIELFGEETVVAALIREVRAQSNRLAYNKNLEDKVMDLKKKVAALENKLAKVEDIASALHTGNLMVARDYAEWNRMQTTSIYKLVELFLDKEK